MVSDFIVRSRSNTCPVKVMEGALKIDEVLLTDIMTPVEDVSAMFECSRGCVPRIYQRKKHLVENIMHSSSYRVLELPHRTMQVVWDYYLR